SFSRDWSSDVCSSDLPRAAEAADVGTGRVDAVMTQFLAELLPDLAIQGSIRAAAAVDRRRRAGELLVALAGVGRAQIMKALQAELGRASCRCGRSDLG